MSHCFGASLLPLNHQYCRSTTYRFLVSSLFLEFLELELVFLELELEFLELELVFQLVFLELELVEEPELEFLELELVFQLVFLELELVEEPELGVSGSSTAFLRSASAFSNSAFFSAVVFSKPSLK